MWSIDMENRIKMVLGEVVDRNEHSEGCYALWSNVNHEPRVCSCYVDEARAILAELEGEK